METGSTMLKALIAAIVIMALGTPVTLSADDQSAVKGKTVKVTYADLNLQKQEGAKILYRRLERASKQVCELSKKYQGIPGHMRNARQCYKLTLTDAVEEIDNELLTQIHNN